MASVREHVKKNGSKSWYVLWRDPDLGKQTSMSFAAEAQAENMKRLLNANGQRLAVVERGLQQAAAAKKVMTTREAFTRHLSSLTRANGDTRKDYRRIWDNRLAAHFDGIPIAQVTDEHVGAWVQEATTKYERKTIANTIGLLSSVFKTAIRRGWAESNPCELISLPADESIKRKATFLTVDEFWLFHDLFPERHRLMLRAFAASGLRFSEMTALEVETTRDALRRKVPVLPVVRAWKEDEQGGFYLGQPKAESIRDVSIPRDLADEILEHMEQLEPEALVFGNRFGHQLRNTTFHQHGWQETVRAARKAGLRKSPRPHDLRHTHASWMLAEGMSAYDLSKRLGHKSISTTEQIYGHLMPKALTEGAEAVARAMRRS